MEGFTLYEEDFDLPDKPSAGLTACLDDLEMCEKHPKYKIGMNTWHAPLEGGICFVCLGGARLARLLDNPAEEVTHVLDTAPSSDEKINAMDFFRSYSWFDGMGNYLLEDIPDKDGSPGQEMFEKLEELKKIPYFDGPEKFKKNMRKAAEIMESYGC